MNNIPESEEREILLEVLHNLPNDANLKAMSFADLASELSKCIKDSPKIQVIEREIKKRLAQDQAKINLPNILIGAAIAGFFTIVGALVGGHLKTCQSCQQVTPSATVQQAEKSQLNVQPPSGNVPAIVVVPVVQPPSHPADVQKNAQPSKANP